MSGPSAESPRILVCDDEFLIRVWVEEKLGDEGYDVVSAGDGASAIEVVEAGGVDLVLLDLRLPDLTGLDVLDRLKAVSPELPVIMITAHGDIGTAVKAVRRGAHHFLEKPVQLPELLVLMEQALEKRRLIEAADMTRDVNQWTFSGVTLAGVSDDIRAVAETIEKLSDVKGRSTVLLEGESGTGKDVVARAIHAHGPRSGGPFIAVNCTSLPENLVESELFGHEAGAFTGAQSRKRGLVQLAHQGTIFLDEIGDMPMSAQAKLLRFLESRVIRRVGGEVDLQVDVQVIAATNRRLEDAVHEGAFREDLFYRINVLPIRLSPIRERPEDVKPLTRYFLSELSGELRMECPEISKEALAILERYDWPGNARQIRNVLERILLMDSPDRIEPDHLPDELLGVEPRTHPVRLPPGGLDLSGVERSLLSQSLQRAQGNKSKAARLLGLSRDTLRYRLEKHGIADSDES